MDKKTRESLLVEYNPPQWMMNLKNIPTHRIKMAIQNTPVHRWYLPGVPKGYEVYIKREDLTGCVLSGNKVRGLEFVFGEAVKQGCTSVCSMGPVQSNCLRTMSLMASSIGMQTHFVVHGNKDSKSGNDLLACMAGANRYLVPYIKALDYENQLYPKAHKLEKKIREELDDNVYTYAYGSGPYSFGYLHVFDEMLRQDVGHFSDMVLCGSTGSTTFGLALGNHLNQCNIKIHTLQCGDETQWGNSEINKMLRYVGSQEQDGSGLTTDDIVEMTDCHGAGDGVNTQEEIDFIKRVAAQTGIILGSTYTGKAAYNMVKRLNEQPENYQGKNILFIHTGGIFENFDGRLENAFDNDDNNKQWDTAMNE